MGSIVITTIAFLAALLLAAGSNILSDEFKAWRPRLVTKLISAATALLGDDDRARYHEEWSAFVEETPGDLGKLVCACGLMLAAFRMSDRRFVAMGAKRIMDISVSTLTLVLIAPVLIVVVALVALEGGPVIVSVKRLGRHGKPFNSYRFRTSILAEEPSSEPTMLGSILRKNSLDHLPQLLNVIRGDMSLVGPRAFPPMMPKDEESRRILTTRQKMRPGLTGLGQTLEYPQLADELASDLLYVSGHSLALDVGIFVNTGLGGLPLRHKKLAIAILCLAALAFFFVLLSLSVWLGLI